MQSRPSVEVKIEATSEPLPAENWQSAQKLLARIFARAWQDPEFREKVKREAATERGRG